MTKSKSFNKILKQRAMYHALMESILEDKDAMDEDTEPSKKAKSIETSKGTSNGTSKSQPKSTVNSSLAEETVFEAGDTQEPQNQGQDMGNIDDQPNVKAAVRNITPTGSTIPRLQEVEDLQGDDLLYYDAEMELMNMILLSIPNEIYNSVGFLETDLQMNLINLLLEPESLVSVYNRFAQLMNDLERNNMKFPTVSVNTKFLNSLQPEWLKYVTQVRLAKQLTVDSFDDLFDYLSQLKCTIDDDQINSNIQFDYVKGNVNSGSVEKDTHVYDLCALETLARNAYDEAAKQQRFAQKNSKRASMFYTSNKEIALNDFCRDQVKPLLNELLDYFDGFQNLFQRDIKEMKDAFEQNDVYLDEIERQKKMEFVKDQLLEASLKHDIELCVLKTMNGVMIKDPYMMNLNK
ncbi:hypothetical protein Tco_0773198 [Tanacetum coccineum]|uniref:Uncharacterized protein n=1 Tax=Tanacetum coccineum TaxID=301880 RepID=A0ABQ4ZN22_9ASTR